MFQGELLEVRDGNLHEAKKLLTGHPLVRQMLLMGDRLMITVADCAQARGPLQQYLAQAGMQGSTVKGAAPGLEDVFVQVITREEERENRERS
jgi:hypothetical protein